MSTSQEDSKFGSEYLDGIRDWIRANCDPGKEDFEWVAQFNDPNEVYGDTKMDEWSITWVQSRWEPQDVFPDSELEGWAKNNGFVRNER